MNETIQKGQYLLKAKIKFFLFTQMNLILLVFCYFITNSLIGFLTLYGPLMFVVYKFLFSKTRMDNPYNIFLLRKISDLIRNLRKC